MSLLISGCGLRPPTDSLAIRTQGNWASVSSGNEGRISTGWLATFPDSGLTRSGNWALQHDRSLNAVRGHSSFPSSRARSEDGSLNGLEPESPTTKTYSGSESLIFSSLCFSNSTSSCGSISALLPVTIQ